METTPRLARVPKRNVVLAVVAAVVLLAAAIGGVLWIEFTRSPAYSVARLGNAIQNKDWNGVQKYVDVDAVVGQAVDVAVSKAVGGDTGILGELGSQVASSTKPVLAAEAKTLLKQGVEQGLGSVLPNQDVLVSSFVLTQVKSTTYVANEARVTVEVPLKTGAPFELKLRMRRVDDHWRVVAIENVGDVVGAVAK
jgi:hypothetical protein